MSESRETDATVLVTGASGFVGRRLCHRLACDGWQVFGLSRTAAIGEATTRWLTLDLRERFDHDKLPDDVVAVIHLAADRRRSEMGPERLAEETATNVEATARLYAWAAACGVQTIVHVSTADVYARGPHDRELPTEEAPLVAVTGHPYAVTKGWGEQVALRQSAEDRQVVILRPTNVYGPGQPNRSLLAGLRSDLEGGEPIPIAHPNGHRYAPLFVDDLVDVLAWATTAREDHLLNVGGSPIYEREVLRDLRAILGLAMRLAPTAQRSAYGVALSLELLDRTVPDRKRTPWKVGLELTYSTGAGEGGVGGGS